MKRAAANASRSEAMEQGERLRGWHRLWASIVDFAAKDPLTLAASTAFYAALSFAGPALRRLAGRFAKGWRKASRVRDHKSPSN